MGGGWGGCVGGANPELIEDLNSPRIPAHLRIGSPHRQLRLHWTGMCLVLNVDTITTGMN